MAKNNDSGLELKAQNNLEAIEGIGPFYAKLLNKVGIHSFADLAKYDSLDYLHQELIDKAGVDVPIWKIENKGGQKGSWLHQAIEMQKDRIKNHPPTKEKGAIDIEWDEYVGFMIFFDSKTDDEGERVWRTRTYMTENNGEGDIFHGVEPKGWVDWIFKQAQLPNRLTAFLREFEASTKNTEILDTIVVKNLKVELNVDPLSSILKRKLNVEVQFEISGTDFSRLIENRSSFLIQIWLIELDDMSGNQVATIEGRFDPDMLVYTRKTIFSMPAPGRYELRTILLLTPPYEKLESYSGPIFNVVPEPFVLEPGKV